MADVSAAPPPMAAVTAAARLHTVAGMAVRPTAAVTVVRPVAAVTAIGATTEATTGVTIVTAAMTAVMTTAAAECDARRSRNENCAAYISGHAFGRGWPTEKDTMSSHCII